MESLTQFYGIDWVGAILAISGIYYIGNGRLLGFALNTAAVLCGLAVSAMISSIPWVVMNIILAGLNIRGIVKWKQSEKLGV